MSTGGIASVQNYALGGKVVSAIFNRIFKKAEKGEDVTKDIQKALDDEKLTPDEAGDLMEVSLSPGSSYNVAAVGAKAADAASDVAEVVPQTIGGRMAAAARRRVGPKTAAGLGATGAGLGFLAGMPTPPEAPELTDYAKSRLSDVEKARAEGFPTDPTIKVDEDTGGDNIETETPQTFLDMLRGAGGRVLEGLQDPATRYALAKAAQPSEGVVPRNFFSDFTLGQEEYKQLEARRKALEDDDETALMQNLKLLKAEKPEASVDELLNLLLSKDTESDLTERYQDTVLSLFNEKSSDPENTGKSDQELLSEARQQAANIIYGIPLAGMADASGATEIPLQEP